MQDHSVAFTGFGPVYQMGYLVEDIVVTMEQWIHDLGVGPWLYLPHLDIQDFLYNGKPSAPDISLALSYAGHLQVELIQQHNDAPSMYQEWRQEGRYGVQHLGYVTQSFATDLEQALAHGYRIGQQGRTGTRGPFTYLYMPYSRAPQMVIELIDVAHGRDVLFATIKTMTEGWDGHEPIRRTIA